MGALHARNYGAAAPPEVLPRAHGRGAISRPLVPYLGLMTLKGYVLGAGEALGEEGVRASRISTGGGLTLIMKRLAGDERKPRR